MRPNAIDRYVTDQNFAIKFEKANDKKKTPIATCNNFNSQSTSAQIATTLDYRQGCNPGVNDAERLTRRLYPTAANKLDPAKTTWATHPAFTWTDGTAANTKELNGIWVGKFETSGSTSQPTIKPNSKHIGYGPGGIGGYYDIAKSIGKLDSNNTGGNGTAITQNNNNLDTTSTHMLKNSEWGAATYLSASKYGAGANGTQINSASDNGHDGNGQQSTGYTGCGPNADGGTSTYTCATSTDHQYQSAIGELSSTTNNTTGIYDMSGGAWEYVMGNLTTAIAATTTSSTSDFKNPTKPPYVDLYKTSDGFGTKPAWSNSSTEYLYNNDVCTWSTCAGQALNETKTGQAVSGDYQSWGGDYSGFPYADSPWSGRGGRCDNGSSASLFFSGSYGGYTVSIIGFRVVAPAGLTN